MEKNVLKRENVSVTNDKLPEEILRYFEFGNQEDINNLQMIVLDIDGGYINNWHALSKDFEEIEGKKIGNVHLTTPEDVSTTTMLAPDPDRSRQGIQKFVFEIWKNCQKEKIGDFIERVGFKSFKSTMYLFMNREISGISLHRGNYNLNDPRGISRIFFAKEINPDIVIKILLNEELGNGAPKTLVSTINAIGSYSYERLKNDM
jgi:hypothetical protein